MLGSTVNASLCCYCRSNEAIQRHIQNLFIKHLFAKVGNGWKPLASFARSSILTPPILAYHQTLDLTGRAKNPHI